MTSRSEANSAHGSPYAPFRGLSAWFSSSVHPGAAKTWKRYGGTYASEKAADYLFSDDASSKDTIRVYNEQRDKGIALFVSSWIKDVIRQRLPPEGVAVGKYLLPPSTVYWRVQKPCEPVKGPSVVPTHPPAPAHERLGVAHADEVAEVGARDVDLLWDELERSSDTIDFKSMVHVDQLELDCAPLYDFNPLLPGYHIQRRK